MLQCRKIYANLLLLSVMLFALGASARTRDCSVFTELPQLNVPLEMRDLRWDSRSAEVVYRGQQITATVSSELELLVPDAAELNITVGSLKSEHPEQTPGFECDIVYWSCSRAPPQKRLSV